MAELARTALVMVGSAYGGPLGAIAGSLVGGLLFPEKLPDIEGPRLKDRRVTSSTLGSPINNVYGTYRVNGNIIWSGGIVETAHERSVGGKGGPTQVETSYTYDASFAVALCEGEVTGVRRIWADGKIIYDVGVSATATQVLVSNQAGVTIYNGSETQVPDATIQVTMGLDNTPANRGICHLVFNQLQLEIYGNRLPNITAEVVSSGSVVWAFQAIDVPDSNDIFWDNGAMDAMHYWDGVTSYFVRAPYEDTLRETINVEEYAVTPGNKPFIIGKYSVPSDYQSVVQWPMYPGSSNNNSYLLDQYYYTYTPTIRHRVVSLVKFDSGGGGSQDFFNVTDSSDFDSMGEWPVGNNSHLWWANWDDLFVVGSANNPSTDSPVIKYNKGGGAFIDTGIDVVSDQDHPNATFHGIIGIRLTQDFLFIMPQSAVYADILKYDKKTFELIDQWSIQAKQLDFDVVNSDDILITNGANILIYKNFSSVVYETIVTPGVPTGTSGSASAQYTHNIFMASDYNSYAFWYSFWQTDAAMSLGYKDLSSNTVTLASVITTICASVELEASDIDVSNLTETVTGYIKDGPMTGRAALEPLLDGYNVVGFEQDWKIVFMVRAASVEAIDEGDFVQPKVKLIRQGDNKLPRRVTTQYADVARDYIISSQMAQRVN